MSAVNSSFERVRFNLSLEGGLRYELNSWLHFRALARLPMTLLTKESNVFCFEDQSCAVSLNTSPLVQGDFQMGLGLRF